MNKIWAFTKPRLLVGALVAALVMSVTPMGVEFQNGVEHVFNSFIIGSHGGLGSLTIGPQKAYAAGTIDYTYDGVPAHDTSNITALLAHLATHGGGEMVTLTANVTVTGAITVPANVTIRGTGSSSYFARNGVDPIFIASANDTFYDLRFDNGGITALADTQVFNVTEGVVPITVAGGLIQGSQILATDTVSAINEVSTTNLTGTNGSFSNNVTVSGNLTAKTGRGATYIVAASDAPASIQRQADYKGSDYATNALALQAAINDANALGGHQSVLAFGVFTGTAEITAKSNVDVEIMSGNITITTNNNDNGVIFNNVTNSVWRNVYVTRIGTVPIGNADYQHAQAILVEGDSDNTLKFYNVTGDNQVKNNTGSFNGWVVRLNTAVTYPYFENIVGYGGARGNTTNSQCNGIWITRQGSGTYVHPIGWAGGGGWSNGITIEEPTSPILYSPEGHGGNYGDFNCGILNDNSSAAIIYNPTVYGGAGNTEGNGIEFWGSTTTVIGGVASPGTTARAGGSNYAIGIHNGASPRISGLTGTLPITSAVWGYDSANNGRFSPGLAQNYWLNTIEISTLAAHPGMTVDIGTTVGGHEVVQGADLTTNGIPDIVVSYTRQMRTSAQYFYATINGGAIANGDIRVYYSVMAADDGTYNLGSLEVNSRGNYIIKDSTLLGNGANGVVHQVNSQLNGSIENTHIENLNAVSPAIQADSNMTSYPVYKSVVIGTLVKINSFSSDSFNKIANATAYADEYVNGEPALNPAFIDSRLVLNARLWSTAQSGTTVYTDDQNKLTLTPSDLTWTNLGRFGSAGSPTLTSSNASVLALSNNFSVEAWINTTNSTHDGGIVYRRVGQNNWSMSLGSVHTGRIWIALWVGGVETQDLDVPTVLSNNTWYHVVWTYSSTNGSAVYIDGTSVYTDSYKTNLDTNSGGIIIARLWAGTIGEVRQYNAVLTQDDITRNFNLTKWRYGK